MSPGAAVTSANAALTAVPVEGSPTVTDSSTVLDGRTPQQLVGTVDIYNQVLDGIAKSAALRRAERSFVAATAGPDRDQALRGYLAAVQTAVTYNIDREAARAVRNIPTAWATAAAHLPAVLAALQAYAYAVRAVATARSSMHMVTVAGHSHNGAVPGVETGREAGETWRAEQDRLKAACTTAHTAIGAAVDHALEARRVQFNQERGPMESRSVTALTDRLPAEVDHAGASALAELERTPIDPNLPAAMVAPTVELQDAEVEFRVHGLVDAALQSRLDPRVLGGGTHMLTNATAAQHQALVDEIAATRARLDANTVQLEVARARYDTAFATLTTAQEAEHAADLAERRSVLAELHAASGPATDVDRAEKEAVKDIRAELGVPAKTTARKMYNDKSAGYGRRSETSIIGAAAESVLFAAAGLARQRALAETIQRQVDAIAARLAQGGLRLATMDELTRMLDYGQSLLHVNDAELVHAVEEWLNVRPESMAPGQRPARRARKDQAAPPEAPVR